MNDSLSMKCLTLLFVTLFSADNELLKMTSMLVHKCKILNYSAPLILVPPPMDTSNTFFRQSQPIQNIRDGTETMQVCK